jgi:nucleoside-diphosphate-sugar epimerase
LPSGGRGILNHVHIDNLVDAMFAALVRDAHGPFTVTDGAETTCKQYFAPLALEAGRRGIPTAPAALLRPLFAGLAGLCAVLGREPPAARSSVDYLMRPHPYSIEKARRELGYQPSVGLEEGMRRVRTWLGAQSTGDPGRKRQALLPG